MCLSCIAWKLLLYCRSLYHPSYPQQTKNWLYEHIIHFLFPEPIFSFVVFSNGWKSLWVDILNGLMVLLNIWEVLKSRNRQWRLVPLRSFQSSRRKDCMSGTSTWQGVGCPWIILAWYKCQELGFLPLPSQQNRTSCPSWFRYLLIQFKMIISENLSWRSWAHSRLRLKHKLSPSLLPRRSNYMLRWINHGGRQVKKNHQHV